MSKTLYVGNLQWQVTENDLKDFFSQCGKIESVRVIRNKETGKSKGYGFVTMAIDADADKAMKDMDGRELRGRAIRINMARERTTDYQRAVRSQTYP